MIIVCTPPSRHVPCVGQVLASQLTNELRALFPNNAVEFFVSYYDYFMPEAFVSSSDTYIDKV